MAVSVTAEVKGVDKYVAGLNSLKPSGRNAGRGMRRAAELIQANAAQVQIVRGRGMKAPPLTDRLSGRTGALAGSIAIDTTRLPKSVRIGTALVYGAVHELGTPKRPFLRPAVVAVARSAESVLALEWSRDVR